MKPYHRSKLKQTAAAFSGVPSWNFTPRRRKKVQVRPSLLVFQLVANLGTTFVRPGASSTRPSSIWFTTRAALVLSIEQRLYTLPPDTVVYPGHGPRTTIRDEMELNPFVVHPRYR